MWPVSGYLHEGKENKLHNFRRGFPLTIEHMITLKGFLQSASAQRGPNETRHGV
jgi:hypothetical protein